jgi:outer membrane protein OmpA-like peptidoglycan-associated protein
VPPPLHPLPPPKVDGDADGDGVPDSADRCPNEAEDKDMFDDTDGCPDPDNDADGFADDKDKCPLDAEDKDGFQDDDGCPEKDNDGDGINDAQDKCPDQPEDRDGYQDVDGCPDPDNDSDGILDQQDACPNEPETINGNADDDGCPDRGDALVVVTPSGVELTEAVQFSGTKVAKASTNVLNQVAATLRAHQEIVRLKIVVHVQPTGNDAADQDQSDRRAQAVRDWLVQWGIPQTRLSVMGLGGTKPLVPRASKNAALINDRVELIILERK